MPGDDSGLDAYRAKRTGGRVALLARIGGDSYGERAGI